MYNSIRPDDHDNEDDDDDYDDGYLVMRKRATAMPSTEGEIKVCLFC